MQHVIADCDASLMRRCIALSKQATREGEFPFACVIARNGEVVAEATNRVARDGDVTRHAEILAISAAQAALGKGQLDGCTLYSNVEPCAMCAFPIRESRISRVVFAISSPLMGGRSRWDVLADQNISSVMPEAFGHPPRVIAGLLRAEAEQVWRSWNPLIWGIIRYRGCFGREDAALHEATPALASAHEPRARVTLWQRLTMRRRF